MPRAVSHPLVEVDEKQRHMGARDLEVWRQRLASFSRRLWSGLCFDVDADGELCFIVHWF